VEDTSVSQGSPESIYIYIYIYIYREREREREREICFRDWCMLVWMLASPEPAELMSLSESKASRPPLIYLGLQLVR
jgi:hypothetical protein